MTRALRALRPFLPIVFAVALLAALAKFSVHPGEVWDELGKTDFYWIPALLAANLVSDVFRAVRWQQMLPEKKRPSVWLLLFAAHIGSAVNLLIPLRAGEAVRVRIVNQRTGVEPAVLVATIFEEVLSDLVTFSIYIAIGLALTSDATFLWPVALVAVIAAAVTLGGGWLLAFRSEEWAKPKETHGVRNWMDRHLYSFARGLAPLRDPWRLAILLTTAQGTWFFETLMFYLSGRALGVDLGFPAYMLIVVTANVAGSVPLTQAGFGVFELGVGGLMRALGVPTVEAATYALFVHVLLTTPHLLYGPLAATVLRIKPSDILFVKSEALEGTEPVAV